MLRIEYLQPPTASSKDDGDGLTAAETEALALLASDPEERCKFWGMFHAYYKLQAWGFDVYQFMHRCPCCPEHNAERAKKKGRCPFAGRRMIELSAGKCQEFLHQLNSSTLLYPAVPESSSGRTGTFDNFQSLASKLPNYFWMVNDAFTLAKRKVALRFQQGTSFYTTFPWNICKLLNYVQQPRGTQRDRASSESKLFAQELLQSWSSGTLPSNTFASRFFHGSLLSGLQHWASSDEPMQSSLLKELLSYGLSLVVMQRLESRHHLVNLRMVPSRASGATAVSAFLRRKLNPDIHQENFRLNFERYLHEFDQLVPEEWGSMSELHKLVSGHNLNVMFQDTSKEDAMIAAVAAPRGANTTEMLAFQAHVKAVLKDGGYYALPTDIRPDGSTQYLLVQFVSSKPEAKKYMEKILHWGRDMWHEQAAVITLGTVVVQPPVTLLDDIPSNALVPLPASTTASVGTVGTMEPVSIAGLFKYGFEHVYQFQDVGHVCEVSEEAVNNAIEDDEEPELEGMTEQCAHVSIAGDPLRMCFSCSATFLATGCARTLTTAKAQPRYLRQAVFEVCKQALQTGLPLTVSEDSRESVDWLVSHDLAAHTLDGRMVLLSSCMRNVTHLASPVLLTHPEDDFANSTWGLRKKLCEQGWTASGVASAASARDKIFNSKNPAKSYYCLLLRCCWAV